MTGARRAATVSADLLAPVRPSWKERYPLVPIERYADLDDIRTACPFDPWLRVHARMGAEILHDRTAVAADQRRRRELGGSGRAAASPRPATTCSRTGWPRCAIDVEADVGTLLGAERLGAPPRPAEPV